MDERGGRFRRERTLSRPDIYGRAHFPEPAICQHCRAIWKKGRWSLDEALRQEVMRWERPKTVICPACRRIMDDYPAGIVTLKGAYLLAHKEEILQTIRNEEENSKHKNPLERIMKIEESLAGSSTTITITTTDSRLARRLGRVVNKANGGELTIKFSHQDELVRVHWERD